MILSCLITFHFPKDDVLSIFDSIRGNCADANFRISVRFKKAPENPKKGKKDDKKSAKDKKGKSKAQSTKASRPESQAEIGFRKKLYSKLKIKKNPNFEVQNLNIRKTQLKLLTFIMNPIRQKKKRLKFMVKVYLFKT